MGKAPKTASIDDILAVAENPEYVRVATASVLLRQDLAARHEQLEAALQAAIETDDRLNETPLAPRLAAELRDLEAEIEAAKVEFRFRAIGKKAWADLLRAHPPTKAQTRERAGLDHNPETFPVAAVAASCVEPAMTVEQAERLDRSLNQAQFDLLWAKCIDANLGGLRDPKSLLAAGMTHRANGESGTIAASEESLEASS